MSKTVNIITIEAYQFQSQVWLSPNNFMRLYWIVNPLEVFECVNGDGSELKNTSKNNKSVFYFYHNYIPHISINQENATFEDFTQKHLEKEREKIFLKNNNLSKENNNVEDIMKKLGDSIFKKKTVGDTSPPKETVPNETKPGYSHQAIKIISLRQQISENESRILAGDLLLQEAVILTDNIEQLRKEIEKILQLESN